MTDQERQGLEEEEQEEEFAGWDLEGDNEPSGEGEDDTPEPDDGGQEPQQPERFKFSDEAEAETAGGQDPGGAGQSDDEYIEIVHRGEKKFVHKDKAKELIQKGYDYDVKVGPHARMVQLIQSDPNAAQMLDQYFRQKMSGQQPQQGQGQQQQQTDDPFTGYEDDDIITAADARKALQRQQETIQQAIQRQQQQAAAYQQRQGQQAGMTQVQMMLQSRDPQNFQKVAPRLQEFAAKTLTKEQYDRVNSDPSALCEFYDYVATQVTGGPQSSGGRKAAPASFRAQSGGGQPPRGKDGSKKIWEMPRKDFEAEMAKIKGY